MSKLKIDSNCLSKSEYGIIQFIINCSEKWINYTLEESSDDIIIKLTKNLEEYEETFNKSLFGFDLEKEGYYIRLNQQEKDQIIFYWIPIRLSRGDRYAEKVTNGYKKRNSIS